MRIIAAVFDISPTEAGAIQLVIVCILGFAWWRWRRGVVSLPNLLWLFESIEKSSRLRFGADRAARITFHTTAGRGQYGC